MNGRIDERSVELLRRRAERAMDEGRGRRVIEPLLLQLLEHAPEGDACRIFAHRHLAELHLENDPWGAALHLRRVIGARPQDDVAYSLMALAQALLGNYPAAVSYYRRALQLEPNNPWYHHNLGHLLDVALDQPFAALRHLEIALQHADPPEHEITASVAHCLARVGRMDDARQLAEQATYAAPENADHRALLTWIERGAPAGVPIHLHRKKGAPTREAEPARAATPADAKPLHAAVSRLLGKHLREDVTSAQLSRARDLWANYASERNVRGLRAEVCAAAVHYAMLVVLGVPATKAAIAERYGVSPKSVAARFADLESVLDLRRADPRYS